MKTFSIGLLFLLTTFLGAEERTWTRSSDGKTVRGEMLSQDAEKGAVTIEIRGKSYDFEIDSFSEEDQKYLADERIAAEKRLEALEGLRSKQQKHLCEQAEVKTWHSYLPAGYDPDGDPHPVCFVYSGRGQSVSVLERLVSASDELNWVIIGVDAYSNRRVKQSNQTPSIIKDCQLVQDMAFEEFNIDREKVVYGGMSGGAWWAFRSSHELEAEAAGILSFGGWMSKEYTKPYPRKMAVAIVNGDRDDGANSYVEPDKENLEKKHRAEVKTFTFSGGHTMAPAKVAAEAARWIHETKGF